MMEQEQLLQVCICPLTGQSLRPATEGEILQACSLSRQKFLSTRPEENSCESVWKTGLVCEDGSNFYPVIKAIPLLLASEAIRLK